MATIDRSINPAMADAREPANSPPSLSFVFRAKRAIDRTQYVVADRAGIRINPQPNEQDVNAYISEYLGFLPPAKNRLRAYAWLKARDSEAVLNAERKRAFLSAIATALAKLAQPS